MFYHSILHLVSAPQHCEIIAFSMPLFGHGELNVRKVLVDEHARLSGIVDLEKGLVVSGHWDCIWLRMVDEIFGVKARS